MMGFSLVELSIVLVILGLLVGGILSGRALIRASELRTITTQVQQMTEAVHSFREKYFAYPGDMPNATQVWGVTPDCEVADTGTATCDGDGDGLMPSKITNDFVGNRGVSLGGNDEHFRFWQHLANAGLIEGQFNGVDEQPTLKLDNKTFLTAIDLGLMVSVGTLFDGEYVHILGAPTQLLPEEMWNIDTKVDDGKPGTGKLVVYTGIPHNISDCTDTAVTSNMAAQYLLTGTDKVCGFVFRSAF